MFVLCFEMNLIQTIRFRPVSTQLVWTLRSQSILGQFANCAHFVQASVESTSPGRLFCMQNYAFRFGWSRNARQKVYSAMGINCLLPFVKNYLKSVNIKDFEGKLIAVDASRWLHKTLPSVCAKRGASRAEERMFCIWIQVLGILYFRSHTNIIQVCFQWR